MPSQTSSSSDRGQMDTKSVRCLVNSISRFVHLVSCPTLETMPTQKSYKKMASLLKLLKPVLDDIVDCKIPSSEALYKVCEELDIAVNEAKEFTENWYPKMSRICSLLQGEPLVMNIRTYSLEICGILCKLLPSSNSTLRLTGVQHCMRELQCLELDRVSKHIEEALKSQIEGKFPPFESLIELVESLSFMSSEELLRESVALERERMKAQVNKMGGELVQISHIVDLFSHMRNCVVQLVSFKYINGLRVPSYFLCPLSLDIMLDPVTVASGQTYERGSIQMWLDNGLAVCPKTRQMLSHRNLIPNYTVKALVENWFQDNNIKLSNTLEHVDDIPIPSHSEKLSAKDLIHAESFHYTSHSNDSTSISLLEDGNRSRGSINDVSFRFSEEDTNECSREFEKVDHSISPVQSYIHSRSESASSAVSSIEYLPTVSIDGSRMASKHDDTSLLSEEMTSICPTSLPNQNPRLSPLMAGRLFHNSKSMAETTNHGSCNYPSMFLSTSSEPVTAASNTEKLVEDLKSQCNEVQTSAAAELRLLAKHNNDNRVIIGDCGAVSPLVSLLYSEVKITQEHAVTGLLNLSINDDVKTMIAEAGALEPLIYVLKTGNPSAKENAAATLFSLSVLEQYRIKIGRSGAVKALVELLGTGTLRGKKDAATALFNLSILHENKARIVQAGAVKYLVGLMDPPTEMVDKAVALLANLSTIAEGCSAIAQAGGIPLLVEIADTGSQRGKENVASILFQLCINNPRFCRLVLQEGAVPPLVALSQSGTQRAKEKAQQLLCHFRNQREGAMVKGGS